MPSGSSTLYRRLKLAPSAGRLVPAYAALGILKHVVPLPVLARWAWSGRSIDRDPAAERQVILTVCRLRSWLGRDRDCLQSSLLLYRELSRLGANPTLEVGFRRHADRTEGHAWVEVDQRIVLDGPPDKPFVTTMRFGPAGALLPRRDA